MARPGDWSALKLSGDPTPGDPAVLLSVADYMDAMATNAQTADTGLGQVVKTSGDGAFVGKTADWLREQVTKEMQGFVAGVKQAFTATGPAIRSYVSALKEAQSKADNALSQAAGADEARIATLKADAEAAGSDLTAAAATAKTAIHDATSYIRSPTTPKSACDIFWEIFGWLTLIISIVAIFVGGPLGLIAFGMGAALAVKAIVDFAEGKTNVLGLVLGLLGILGPSTKPLIGLSDLTKLVKVSTAAITKVAKSGATTFAKGLTDFWHMAQTFSFTQVMRGIGDLSVVLANTVKVGLVNIPKTVSALDSLAVKGFVTLNNFVVHDIPKAITTTFPAALLHGLTTVKGLSIDLAHLVGAGAVGVGKFAVKEFGGWKALRLFTPLAANEIGKFGVLGAFKIGVLGRGLGIERFSGLGTVGAGVRLTEGLTAVNIIKPGDTPHAGGAGSINFSESGMHLPDLTEHPVPGVHGGNTGFSAHGFEFAGVSNVAPHDLSGLSHVNAGTHLATDVKGVDLSAMNTANLAGPHGLPGGALHLSGADLGALGRMDVGRLAAMTGGIDQVNLPAMGGLGAATLPNMQIGNLSAGLNKFAHGVDGLTGFGTAELRSLHTGDVNAVRISDTSVSFNLGSPETAFTSHAVDLTGTAHLGGNTPAAGLAKADFNVTSVRPGSAHTSPAPHQPSVTQAMDLLADPSPGGVRLTSGMDTTATHSAVAALNRDPATAGLPHQAQRPDQAGFVSPAQADHLRAVDQLRRAQDTLAGASGDALAAARAQKDVRIAESLVRRTADGIRVEPGPPDVRGEVSPDLTPPPAGEGGDKAFQALRQRLDDLRGADYETDPDLAGMELQHRFDQLRAVPGHAHPDGVPGHADVVLPPVPTHTPGQSVDDLATRLDALRDGPRPAELDHLELQARFEALRGAGPDGAHLTPDQFPAVPSLSPADAISRSTAQQRLTHLEDQLSLARAEQAPRPPEPAAAHLDDASLQARLDALRRPDGADGVPDLPHAPTAEPVKTPGATELSVRLDQLTGDAASSRLPADEVKALTGDARTALNEGRLGDAAEHLNALHGKIDRSRLDERLASFRDHVDAGHGRAAQLGMNKVDWLEHAVGIEKAAAGGHTDDLHHLLNTYENALAGHIATQRLHDLPKTPDHRPAAGPGERGGEGTGTGGDGADLQKRIDALRDGGPRDAELDDLELQHRFDRLRGDDHDAPPPHIGGDDGPSIDFPSVPSRGPDEVALDDGLAQRLAALRSDRAEALGISETERAAWTDEFAKAGDEATSGAVLDRYTERINGLERDARLAEVRDGTGALPGGEHKTWQDALTAAGDDQAVVNRILDNYVARLDQYREHSGAQIGAAMSAPDHVRPLDTRLDQSLSSLSKDLRDRNAAEFTTLSDRLSALRGADGTPAPGHGTGAPVRHAEMPSFPETPKDLPAAPKDLPGTPKDRPESPKVEKPAAELPKTEPPKAEVPKSEVPKSEAKVGGDELAMMTKPPAVSTTDTVVPPRDLLGGGPAPARVGRTIEVDTDRFTALREPFRFEKAAGGDHPFTVSRPPAGGEKVAVRYQLDVTEHDLHITLRVHLDADPGVGAQVLAETKAATREGIRRYVNEPGHVLPGFGKPIRMTVEFVDNPELAHASIPLSHDLPRMNQGAWKTGQTPGAYAHEAVHYLGVKDGLRRPDALLRPVEPAGPVPHDLMGAHGHGDTYVLSPAGLGDIAAVLSPHFSGSLGSHAAPMVSRGPENLWASGTDVAPNVTLQEVKPAAGSFEMTPVGQDVEASKAGLPKIEPPKIEPPKIEPPKIEEPAPKEPEPTGELPGLYQQRPELLYEVDSIDDIERLVADIEAGATMAVHQRINATWKGSVPVLADRPAKTGKIADALRDNQQSFFTTGGRSFDVEDGLGDWHRVTVKPEWDPEDTTFLSQTEDKAKFDTRADFSSGTKTVTTSGGTGAIGFSTMFPQRLGAGGGGGAEVALSRPTEAVEDGVRLTDSHNVRSGSGSHLVNAPARFLVTAEDVRGPVGGTGTGTGTGTRGVADPIVKTVTFRAVDDIAKAMASAEITPVHLDEAAMSQIVEHFTPVRILRAGLDLRDGQVPLDTWHDVSERILVNLHPTKTVDPGSLGAGAVRDLLDESSIVSHLIPAMDSPVHPPVVSSAHSAHALSVELDAVMSDFSVLMNIDKSSFRWQPGITASHKAQQTSRVGGALTAVPIRWAFGPAYFQLRLAGGFFRSMNASHSAGSVSRIGTEFKDIKNVGVEAHIQLTLKPALQEVPGSRMPFTTGAVPAMTIDLVVFGRLPLAKALELAGGAESLVPSPRTWFVPPYAKTGGRSVTYGLTQFAKQQSDVTALIRRYEGGFLPKFGDQTKVLRMGSSRAALERAHNQGALDRVISPGGLRQGEPALLKWGLIAELTRTKKIGTRHLIVHVTGRYLNDFDHLGLEKGQSVRNVRADGTQQKITAGGQWRGNVTLESGGILRYRTDLASIGATPGGAIEYRGRFNRQGGAQLSGNEVRLNGGTPDSHAFGNELEITVHLYAFTRRITYDPRAHLRFGRTIEQRLPRAATGAPPATRTVMPVKETVTHSGGAQFARYRLVETKTVRKLYDASSVMPHRVVQESVFTPRPDPMSVNRRTQLDLDSLRDWIDAVPEGEQLKYPVRDWLSVEAMPGNKFILDLARDALTAAQKYADDLFSQTKIGGRYGVESLDEGMSLWTGLISRLNDVDQVSALRSMMNDQWLADKLMTDEAGAQVDLAVVVSLTNPELLPAHGHITVENASIGGVEVDGSKSTEHQFLGKVNFGVNIRKPGTAASTSGGGGLLQVGAEKIAYAKTERSGDSLSGAIERNANNRKGKTRSYIVKFDFRVSVAAELTTDPAKFAMIPPALRTGEWLHHFKSIQRDGIVTNALYLRLSADVVDKLGLLPKLPADPGAIAKPWFPKLDTELRLPPGHGPGLGLYTFHEVPTLTAAMTQALRTAAAHYGERRQIRVLLDKLQDKVENRSVMKISDSVSGMGLADPMLNRRRLLYLFTPDGVKQHWPSMVDGGVSVLHMKPGKLTQHSRDVRLIAEPTSRPKFRGFVASHDDLDIKTTLTSDSTITTQRTHGHAETAGVTGTGVSNHNDENFAMGLGDNVGRSSQKSNTQSSGTTTVQTDLSSGRGVKARMEFGAKFSLVVFDQGKRIGDPLLVVHDVVQQDRWADDLRLPRERTPDGKPPEIKAPAAYRIGKPKEPGPGWTTSNGLPIPPRFTAEDLTQIARLQKTVEKLLTNEAKRLAKPGYAGAHTIRQGMTPHILLPGVGKAFGEKGMDLPTAVSAQIFGQRAKINIKLVPEAASLNGVSSGVLREHAPQTTTGFSAGSNKLVQWLRSIRVPVLGRGFTDVPEQGLEQGGTGVAAGDSHTAAETGSGATGSLGNTKPESRSAAVDYLSRVEVTVTLDHAISKLTGPTKLTSKDPADLHTVTLRMGLHDARTALDLTGDVGKLSDTAAARVQAFKEIDAHEKTLATAADEFIAATEKLDTARFDAYAAPENSAARVEKEQAIPGLHKAWEEAGEKWWNLEQQHYQLLDDFRHDHLGVTAATTDVRTGELSEHIRQQTLDAIEPLPGKHTIRITRTRVIPPAPKPTSLPVTVPGDGRCQLYAMIASNPGRVGDKLAQADLGSPELHAWLGKAAQVRDQLRDLAANPVRDGRGLVPAGRELADAAESLRLLVERNLHDKGAGAVPPAAVRAYRANHFAARRVEVNAMTRNQLFDQLHEYGVTEIRNGEIISTDVLRGAYGNLRARELVAGGQELGAARVTASAEATGGALSKQALLDYIRAHGERFALNNLGDELLRDVTMERYLSDARPLDDMELAWIVDAVGTWERAWSASVGETFLPLLAHVLEARVQVHAPPMLPITVGRDGAPLIQVHRTGDHYDGGRAIESQARAKTRTSWKPVRTVTAKPVSTTPARTVPGGIVHNVPGEGRCQLYSVLAGHPGLTRDRLTAVGADMTGIHDWLGNPQLVRDDLARWRTNGIRNGAGLVPFSSELGRAAEQLRQLVGTHLATLGREHVPTQVVSQYRNHMLVQQVRADIDGMDRDALVGRLRDYGVNRAQHGHLLPLDQLRDAYLSVRTAELVAAGKTAVAAPVLARREVRLNAKGGLADSALSMRQMFDYLGERGTHIDFDQLGDDTLRDMAAHHYLDERRPLDAAEFTGITDAVRNWETTFGTPLGEAFLPLLGSALDVQFRVHQPGSAATLVGRDGAQIVDVFRQGDHFMAVERTTAPPPVRATTTIKNVSRSLAHKVSRVIPARATGTTADFQQKLRTWNQIRKFGKPGPAHPPLDEAARIMPLAGGGKRLAAQKSALPNPDRTALRDQYGMPESSVLKFQDFVNEHGVAVYVRPTNPAGIRWADGLAGPKPQAIKAKTINQLDVRLGASEHTIGLVGLMRPEGAPDHGLRDTLILRMPDDVTAAERPALESRLRQRADEFNRLAPKAADLIHARELGLHHGVIGLRGSDGRFVPITGDHDLFDVRLADSTDRGLVESELDAPSYQAVIDMMVAGDMGVMHGAHMRWNRADPAGSASFTDAADAAMFNHIVHSHQQHGGGEPLIRFAPGEPVSLVWAPREVESGVATPVDLDHEYGPAVYPEKVGPSELDPPRDADRPGVEGEAVKTQEVRLNRALMPLSDFDEFVWGGRSDARWHYVVGEDGKIWIGSEQLLTAVSDRQLDDLFVAMHAKDPALTLRQLRTALNQQGHPAIGVRFTADGHALAGPARIKGELIRDPRSGVWTVDDGPVRDGVQPDDVARRLENVAKQLRAQLGAEVRVRPAGHTEEVPAPEPEAIDDAVRKALALLADPPR